MNKTTIDQILKIDIRDNMDLQLEEINDFIKEECGEIIKMEAIPNTTYILVIVRILKVWS